MFPTLLRRALELVEGCDCDSVNGCPACIQSTECTQYNAVLERQAGLRVLRRVCDSVQESAALHSIASHDVLKGRLMIKPLSEALHSMGSHDASKGGS